MPTARRSSTQKKAQAQQLRLSGITHARRTLVRLLSLVVCRVRPSVHAAYQAMEGTLQVIAKSVYKKLDGTEATVAKLW
ncbi:hypothetical protein ETAA8_58350 [Anatilimnocola aggregata]|uniref:Uncharacterized protein n=1 Tax=Anatilimnocola aggregata TaxID=2528021 RepID=A0A517YKE4_9BACT|nr:hypothetical protein [Anatilimnocola aggregata]QDU30688.1 hypothetical protein ETAA8_58350 [Anatilimnocola aggregata]